MYAMRRRVASLAERGWHSLNQVAPGQTARAGGAYSTTVKY